MDTNCPNVIAFSVPSISHRGILRSSKRLARPKPNQSTRLNQWESLSAAKKLYKKSYHLILVLAHAIKNEYRRYRALVVRVNWVVISPLLDSRYPMNLSEAAAGLSWSHCSQNFAVHDIVP